MPIVDAFAESKFERIQTSQAGGDLTLSGSHVATVNQRPVTRILAMKYDIGALRKLASFGYFTEIGKALKDRTNTHEEENALLKLTEGFDEHPDGYDGPCMCQLCQSYS